MNNYCTLSYIKTSQTKCHKQSDSVFSSFLCSFRWCATLLFFEIHFLALVLIGWMDGYILQPMRAQIIGFKRQQGEAKVVDHLSLQESIAN